MTDRQAVEKMITNVDFLTLKQQTAMKAALASVSDDDIHAIGTFLAAYLKAEAKELEKRGV